MSCKFLNPHTNNELELSKQLMKYYKLDEYEELDDNMSNFLDSQVSYFFFQNSENKKTAQQVSHTALF